MSDDRDHDDAARTNITLVVYGDSPRSIRAAENLKKALVARGVDPRTVETVDVMTEPERALDLRTVAAPQLIIGGLRSNRSLYGDLSDREKLGHWLDEMLDAVSDNASTTPGASSAHQISDGPDRSPVATSGIHGSTGPLCNREGDP